MMKTTHWYMLASTSLLLLSISYSNIYSTHLQQAYQHVQSNQIISQHIDKIIQHQTPIQIIQDIVYSFYSTPSFVLLLNRQTCLQTLAIFVRSKISFVIALNFILSTLAMLSQTFVDRAFGVLNENEKKSCRDSALRFAIFRGVMIAALVPIDIRDISVWICFFVLMGLLHCCYIVARERFSTITVLPSATAQIFYQMIGVLCAVVFIHLVIGSCIIALFHRDTTISIIALLLYENVVAILMCLKMIGKYVIHVRDLNQAIQAWEERQAALVRCEFVFEAAVHLLTAAHYIHVWSFYGLSVTFVDLVLFLHLRSAALTFVDRCSKFHHYRRATAEINNRYPDATPEELRNADDTCAICREPLEQAKKLACNHFFHRNCLLTWLEYKSICPSCRAPLFNSSSWSQTSVSRAAPSPAINDIPQANVDQPVAASGDDNLEATMALIRRLQMEDAASLGGPLGAIMSSAIDDHRAVPPRADVPQQARSLFQFQFDTRNISSFLPSFRLEVVSGQLPLNQPTAPPTPSVRVNEPSHDDISVDVTHEVVHVSSHEVEPVADHVADSNVFQHIEGEGDVE